MDPTQPICVLSTGTQRSVEFYNRYQRASEKSLLSITPVPASLYIMKPGCQEYFKHKVPADKSCTETRYSLSFRRMIPVETASSSPVKDLVSRFDTVQPPQSVLSSPPSTNVTGHHSPEWVRKDDQTPNKPKVRKTTVIFGTSVTIGVDGYRLAYGGRKCINKSVSGAKVHDIAEMVKDFYENDEQSDDVNKIILSLGTNDIKFASNGVNKFRRSIIELVRSIKSMFPGALIYIQCVLPMKLRFHYTARNVLQFNNILYNICTMERCLYIDCFRDFIDQAGFDYNKNLYKDNLHLNRRGIGVLCRWLKHCINRDTFNPYVY